MILALYIISQPIALVFFYMCAVFVIAQILRNNSIVDVAWGVGFGLVSLFTLFRFPEMPFAGLVATALVLIWAMRLSTHIYLRNKGKGEDPRYAAWRKEWGKWVVVRGFFQIFMLQGLILLIIVSPVAALNLQLYDQNISLTTIGTIVWIIGFIFQAVGDAQLRRFISNPANRGRLLMSGLWRYTRHPNYFGEAVMWWGLWIIALQTGYGWYLIISPLLITLLLRHVSGVTMTERRWAEKPDFELYKRQTNAFLPWFPRVNRPVPMLSTCPL